MGVEDNVLICGDAATDTNDMQTYKEAFLDIKIATLDLEKTFSEAINKVEDNTAYCRQTDGNITPDFLKPEILAKCTLRQALEWIAFQWEPMESVYEDLIGRYRDMGNERSGYTEYDQAIFAAEPKLRIAIKKDVIKLSGIETVCTGGGAHKKADYSLFLTLYPDSKFLNDEAIDNKKITDYFFSDDYSFIYCPHAVSKRINEETFCYHKGYFEVETELAALRVLFPLPTPTRVKDTEAVGSTPTNIENKNNIDIVKATDEYSTPYLDIINSLINEGIISKTNQGKAESLKAMIMERGKSINISERLATAMATIMRLPESQKGGAKKQRKKK